MAKVLISIDDQLLRRIDERAKLLGLTRSAFVAQMASAEVSGEDLIARRRRAIERARAVFADAVPVVEGDTTDFVRKMRDERTSR
jgi:metal-responsive CopG/Arc/MetJ family transcriptional regulator